MLVSDLITVGETLFSSLNVVRLERRRSELRVYFRGRVEALHNRALGKLERDLESNNLRRQLRAMEVLFTKLYGPGPLTERQVRAIVLNELGELLRESRGEPGRREGQGENGAQSQAPSN